MIQITKRKKEIKINLNLTNIITQIPLILEYFIYGYSLRLKKLILNLLYFVS